MYCGPNEYSHIDILLQVLYLWNGIGPLSVSIYEASHKSLWNPSSQREIIVSEIRCAVPISTRAVLETKEWNKYEKDFVQCALTMVTAIYAIAAFSSWTPSMLHVICKLES